MGIPAMSVDALLQEGDAATLFDAFEDLMARLLLS